MKLARGFTLMEVIVALALLSLLTLATVAAMRTFGNTRATLEDITGRVDDVRIISQFLRDEISSALPVARVGGTEEGLEDAYGTYFYGDSSRIVWVAPMLGGAGMGGAFAMHLALVENRLELMWHPYLRDVDEVDWSGVKRRVLLEEVEEFSLGYLMFYGQEWEEEWTGEDRLPVSVRLNLRSKERYWPELVIRLSGATLNAR